MDPISLKFKNVRLEQLYRQDIINENKPLFLWVHLLSIGVSFITAIYFFAVQFNQQGTLCTIITLYLTFNFWLGRYKYPNIAPYLLSVLSILSSFQQFYTAIWVLRPQTIFLIASMAMVVHYTLLVGFDFIQNAATLFSIIMIKTAISLNDKPTIVAIVFPFFGFILGYSVYKFQRVQRRLFLQSQQELDNEFYLDQGFDEMILKCQFDKTSNHMFCIRSNQKFKESFNLHDVDQLATFLARFKLVASKTDLNKFIWNSFLKIESLKSERVQANIGQVLCCDELCHNRSIYSFKILFSFLQGSEFIIIFRNETFKQQLEYQCDRMTNMNKHLIRHLNRNQKIIYKMVQQIVMIKSEFAPSVRYLLLKLMMSTQNIKHLFFTHLVVQTISFSDLIEHLNKLTKIFCQARRLKFKIECEDNSQIITISISLVFQLHLLIIKYISQVIRDHKQTVSIVIKKDDDLRKTNQQCFCFVYQYIPSYENMTSMQKMRSQLTLNKIKAILNRIGVSKDIISFYNQSVEVIQAQMFNLGAMIET